MLINQSCSRSTINSTFTGNTAGIDGGAISAYDNLTLLDSAFINNSINNVHNDITLKNYADTALNIINPTDGFYTEVISLSHDNTTGKNNLALAVNLNDNKVQDNTGILRVTLNGIEYAQRFVNSKTAVIISDLTSGRYDVIIKYALNRDGS